MGSHKSRLYHYYDIQECVTMPTDGHTTLKVVASKQTFYMLEKCLNGSSDEDPCDVFAKFRIANMDL